MMVYIFFPTRPCSPKKEKVIDDKSERDRDVKSFDRYSENAWAERNRERGRKCTSIKKQVQLVVLRPNKKS